MKDLAEFIIKNITGSDDFEIGEKRDGERVDLEVKADPSIIGLIIGKEGRTIKAIRSLLVIKAAREEKSVGINVIEKNTSG